MADVVSTYELGQLVTLSVEFRNAAGTLVDPTSVKFRLQKPDNSIVELVYPTDGALQKTSTGKYFTDYTPATAGAYTYRFIGTGAAVAAKQRKFNVTAGI